jgi:hypothetical protein
MGAVKEHVFWFFVGFAGYVVCSLIWSAWKNRR